MAKKKAKKKPKIHTVNIRGWWMAALMLLPKRGRKGAPDDGEYKQYSPEIVYGHNLRHAFSEMRRCHPTADGWLCLGGVKASDIECYVEIPESGTRMILQMQVQKESDDE